jgi:hypothetical protein
MEARMSEPKTVAKQMEEVVPGVFHWQIEDERIHHISDAHAVVEGGRAVLIDPVPLAEEELKRLGSIEAIILGAPSHQRYAWSLRKKTGARVYAPKGAAARLEEKPDVEYGDGDALPGGLRAIHAPGPAAVHYVLYRKGAPGALFLTDLVMNEKDKGLVFLSDKYQDDPAQARASARKLLDLPCGSLCFGHGAPLREEGRVALQRLLDTEKGKA